MKYIQDAFDKNWIAPLGENVDEFEKSLANYLGNPHALASLTKISERRFNSSIYSAFSCMKAS